MPRTIDESRITRHYRALERRRRPALPCPLENMSLTNTGLGLGDTVVLTSLPRAASSIGKVQAVYSQSASFETLVSYNPYYQRTALPFWVAADSLMFNYDLGNGHFCQRLHRAFGLPVELRPRGCIELPDRSRVAGRVVFHFEPGRHADWQRRHLHRRAREVYPEHVAEFQKFVDSRPDLAFFEVGSAFSGLRNVGDWTACPLSRTIENMATCEYFVGILSGPLHVAAALDLKTIVIANLPAAPEIVLPVLRDVDVVESQWLYPQSVILHQDDETDLVRRFSCDNLMRAIDGELYPYWSDRYLSLVQEAS